MPKIEITLAELESRIEIDHFKDYRIGRIDEKGEVIPMYPIPEDKKPHTFQRYFFDNRGRVVKLEEYFKGVKVRTRLYLYDGDDKKVKESYWFNENGELTGIHKYKYNERGLMIWRAEYSPYGYLIYYISSEHEGENLILESWYDRADRLLQRIKYYYDDRGEVIREDKINSEDQLEGYHLLSYDERGNLKEKVWFTANGERGGKFSYKFDEEGLLREIKLFDSQDNLLARHEFIYDEHGNLIEERWYDENGELIKVLRDDLRDPLEELYKR